LRGTLFFQKSKRKQALLFGKRSKNFLILSFAGDFYPARLVLFQICANSRLGRLFFCARGGYVIIL
jgi:hypothetical protein